MKKNKICLILSTVPNKNLAKIIAIELLNKKLAACVTYISKIKSLYYWNKKLQEDEETQLFIKTHMSLRKKIISVIRSLHPYKIPEILIIKIFDGDPFYLSWINKIKNYHIN